MMSRSHLITWLFILTLGSASLVEASELTDARRISINDALTRSTVAVLINWKPVGSGFVATSKRWVITNNHVVKPALQGGYSLQVKFQNGKTYNVEVVGVDPLHDVAILKPPKGVLPAKPLTLGDSDRVRVGETVLAKGSPFGLEGTLTQGIVSSRRDITAPDGRKLKNLIQTDASINPGSSGGPLVNSDGEVVGMNTAIYSKTGGDMGIGFAVPINNIHSLVRRVKSEGARPVAGARAARNPVAQVPRSMAPPMGGGDYMGRPGGDYMGRPGGDYMGRPQMAPPSMEGGQIRTFLGVVGRPARTGLRITKVIQGSPADQAGLRRGMIILSIEGAPVRSMEQLAQQVFSRPPRTPIHLMVRHKRRVWMVPAVLGAMSVSGRQGMGPHTRYHKGPRQQRHARRGKRAHRRNKALAYNNKRFSRSQGYRGHRGRRGRGGRPPEYQGPSNVEGPKIKKDDSGNPEMITTAI